VDKIAFTFPGQGRIAEGSGTPWADDPARWPFERASKLLGWDVLEVIEAGDAALADTRKAQPAIYTHSAACHLLARDVGLRPDLVAGHSLGEYAALAAARSFSLADTARLLKIRGQAMQRAVPVGQGAMAALLGAELAQAEEIAKRQDQIRR